MLVFVLVLVLVLGIRSWKTNFYFLIRDFMSDHNRITLTDYGQFVEAPLISIFIVQVACHE